MTTVHRASPARSRCVAGTIPRVLVAVGIAVALAAPAAASGDPGRSNQWALPLIGAPTAWQTGTGAGITVAIIDTGVHLAHEDLKTKLVGGRNFVELGQPPQDDHGHGTHVAGTVGAATNNGIGVSAVAPGARIMPIRVLANECEDGRQGGDCGARGYVSDIVDGIKWAVDNGADVVNLSLGENVVVRNVLGSQMRDGIEYAWSKGAIPVIAAGNDTLFPSGYRNVNAIVVVATDRNDQITWYSNTAGGAFGSAKWAISAPGGSARNNAPQDDIFSTWWSPDQQNVYGYSAGTSMAVPHVAGAAAILRSLGLSPQATVERLLGTAKDVGPRSTYGAGRLDVARAVQGLGQAPDPGQQQPAAAPPPSQDQTADGTTAAPTQPPRANTPRPGGERDPSDAELDERSGDGEAGTDGDSDGSEPREEDPTTYTAPEPREQERSGLVAAAGLAAAALTLGGGLVAYRRYLG